MAELYKLKMFRRDGCWPAVLAFSDSPAEELETAMNSFLHPSEREHMQEFALERGKMNFLRSRYLVRQALAGYGFNGTSAEVYVAHGVFGQPLLKARNCHPPALSLSHHDDLAACLLFPEEHPMGIDIEKATPAIRQHFTAQVSQAERRLHRRMLEPEFMFLTRLWTMKEALSKVLRTGLTLPVELMEAETIEYDSGHTTGHFKNFPQYKAISFRKGESICSFVLPRESVLAFPSLPAE